MCDDLARATEAQDGKKNVLLRFSAGLGHVLEGAGSEAVSLQPVVDLDLIPM